MVAPSPSLMLRVWPLNRPESVTTHDYPVSLTVQCAGAGRQQHQGCGERWTDSSHGRTSPRRSHLE